MRSVLLGLMLASLAGGAVGQDWGNMATISSTLGNNTNRLCIGDHSRPGDIGCPTWAPSLTTAGNVIVSGSVTAAQFIGDGSGLTNVGAASTDRITSGTTSMLAISSTGFVSLTQSGVNTGWFDPTRGLVTIGVSSTGPISATGLYSSGKLATGNDGAIGGNLTVGSHLFLNDGKILGWGAGPTTKIVGTGTTGNQSLSFIVSSSEAMRIVSSGYVGIGTSSPSSSLHIKGTAANTPGTGLLEFQTSALDRYTWRIDNNKNLLLDLYQNGVAISTSIITFNRGSTGSPPLVGIGLATNTSPTANLEVSGTISASYIVDAGNIDLSAASSGLRWGTGNTYLLGTSGSGGSVRARVNNGGDSWYINASGNTGVGQGYTWSISAPSATLHVGGTARITSWTYIGDNVTATTPLEVSGTVSATRFVGDGSGLTNIGAAGSSDRITSGTTSMIAVSSTGYVSLTQAGTNTGWFDPSRGLVTIGVSSTGPISGTSGYFSGATTATGYTATGPASGFFAPTNGGLFWSSAYNGITGNQNPTSQYIAFTTSGTEAMRIVSSGNVGIGFPSPGAKLEVNGSISGTYLRSAGNLYVGNGVSVTNKIDFLQSNFSHDSSINYIGATFNNYAAAPTGSYITLRASDGAGGNSTNDTMGTLRFLMDYSYLPRGGASISGQAEGNTTASSSPARLVFSTTPSGSYTLAERMRIDSNGRVGIGVTPSTNLEVSGTISATNFVGNGSGLTGIAASTDRIVSGSVNAVADVSSGAVRISGTLALNNTGSEPCDAAHYYTFRANPVTQQLEMCRP